MRAHHRATGRIGSIATAACLTLALVAGCGGDGATARPATEDGLRETALDFGEAVISQRWDDAYAMFSASCQEEVSQSEFADRMEASGYARLSDTSEVRIESAEAVLESESSGSASVTASVGGYPQASGWAHWVYEGGTWRFAECRFGAD